MTEQNTQNGLIEMTLEQFHQACKDQAPSPERIVFRCPMCKTLQTAEDLIAAGAGKDFDEVQHYLAFSCIGRWTGAGTPRSAPDGQPCDWTLGGFFPMHKMVVITPDGERHPRFELATREEADAHRAKVNAARQERTTETQGLAGG